MPNGGIDPGYLSVSFVEGLYQSFLEDPESVSKEWQDYFAAFASDGLANGSRAYSPSFKSRSLFNKPQAGASINARAGERRSKTSVHHAAALQDRVDQLIRAYRVWGHLAAKIDPLGQTRSRVPELDPGHYGFSDGDLSRPFSANTIYGPNVLTLGEILSRMQETYCGSIGVQFMHINESRVKHWLQERMERRLNKLVFSPDQQLRILKKLTDAVVFEEFIQKKYLGAKRFSLEGGETLIPLLQLAIEKLTNLGMRGIILGMAHRGRLNVLANIFNMPAHDIFLEFEDTLDHDQAGHRDVKYHLGYSTKLTGPKGQEVHMSLCFNPSHLEYVNPVALGRTRANQDRFADRKRERGIAILIHGDAAFAGEGIIQETLNLSELNGYTTGGTLHIIVNNQIGFTTDPEDSRSSTYATDVAKMLQVPIFHVNGEDPEAVAHVVDLALDFRAEFKRDVVIDMYCFRLRGHNEGDEPAFTQPLMYQSIKKHPSARQAYSTKLSALGGISSETAEQLVEESRARLDKDLESARGQGDEAEPAKQGKLAEVWSTYQGGLEANVPRIDTGIQVERSAKLLANLGRLPDGFKAHPKIVKGLEERRDMAKGKSPVDWSAAEALAFASLAEEGHRIRLTGQDSQRGTFSQRHSVLHDQKTNELYVPLQHIADKQATVEIYNSPLSEAGVMGFEYGYSLDCPDGLVAWEAQFGDFANAAQVIIDQFIVSAEEKWNYLSGLVLLLPHGFEGMGAEHSHARIERFMLLAAKDNIQLVNPTTPAQYFHVLRRQVLRNWRKPLVVMTPKSLLRHPEVVSSLDDLASTGFKRCLADVPLSPGARISKVLACSGKVYYDLVKHRRELDRQNVAIIRVEQLYPLDDKDVDEAMAGLESGTPVRWVQEEPENMGAWRYLRARFGKFLLDKYPLSVVARQASASPATGSKAVHEREQADLMERAFQAF